MSPTATRAHYLSAAASVASGLVTLLVGAPAWISVLALGAFVYTLLHWALGSRPNIRQASLSSVCVLVGLALSALLVRQYPGLVGLDDGPAQASPRADAKAVTTKAADLKIESLKDGLRVPRCLPVSGTGTIPPGTEVWVAHANDENGVPAKNLMNFRQAENDEVHAGQWRLDKYYVGNEKDDRDFWIYVYELPTAAGSVFRNYQWPGDFREKWPNWQPALTKPIEQPLEVHGPYRVTRTHDLGCDAR